MLPDKADAARQAGALKAEPAARFFFAWAPLVMVEGGLAARSMERVGATWVVAAAGAWQPGRAWAGTGDW